MVPALVTRALTASPRRVRLLAVLPLLLVAACSDGGTGPGDLPVVGTLQAVDGDAQSGTAGETLAKSLVVKVADAKGRVLPGVSVAWSIESGGGSLDATSVSSAAGLAATHWTLGTVAGAASVRATAGERSVSFSATITPGGVAGVSLAPNTFSSLRRSTLIVSGMVRISG